MFSLHGKIALVTLAFLTVAGIYAFSPDSTDAPGNVIDIGLEHARPLTLSVTLTDGTTPSIVEMDVASDETAYLTVPGTWTRTETRRAPIASVTSADTDGGMKKWALPADAGISFSASEPFKTVRVHNPSGSPVKIQVTRVNLADDTSSYDVYLLTQGSLLIP